MKQNKNKQNECETHHFTQIMHVIVSIDVGIKNLGWTILASPNSFKNSEMVTEIEQLQVNFGVYGIDPQADKDNSIVTERCKHVKRFFQHIANNFKIDYVIIERQVNANERAMELMYAITTAAQCYTDEFEDVIIFDPKLKFNLLKIPYDTKNKAHKRLSIEICRSILQAITEDKVLDFDKFLKKDDVADSFNQAFEWMCHKKMVNFTLTNIKKLLH
jgi:hypothetical protein